MANILSTSIITFTLGFASAALSEDLNTNEKSNSISDSFSAAEIYLRESLKTSSLPDPFLIRPDGTRYIPDSTKEQLIKESTDIALMITAVPAKESVTLVRYLAIGEEGRLVRGFTSLAEAAKFFKSKKFTTSFNLIGAKSGDLYGYWNTIYKDWQFGLTSDSTISQLDKLYGTRDPLVAVKNILVNSESRAPRVNPANK
jgi:hypothetical protein